MAVNAAGTDLDQLLDERELSRLHWRCRRGLLENDLFIERFFQRYEPTLTRADAAGLSALMDLADNDLLDLLLRRTEPGAEIDSQALRSVLERLRQSPRPPISAVQRQPAL